MQHDAIEHDRGLKLLGPSALLKKEIKIASWLAQIDEICLLVCIQDHGTFKTFRSVQVWWQISRKRSEQEYPNENLRLCKIAQQLAEHVLHVREVDQPRKSWEVREPPSPGPEAALHFFCRFTFNYFSAHISEQERLRQLLMKPLQDVRYVIWICDLRNLWSKLCGARSRLYRTDFFEHSLE